MGPPGCIRSVSKHREALLSDPRYTLVVGGTIVTCIVLMPVMWHMWIVVGSGNANFYFAVTLIYNVAQVSFVMGPVLVSFFKFLLFTDLLNDRLDVRLLPEGSR